MQISFNEEQRIATEHKDGPMLVLAGPGCGKTAVITGRIKNLIEAGVSPDNILVVTFTVAAASEMKNRFLSLYNGDSGGLIISTFHSIFYKMLRKEYSLRHGCVISEDFKFSLLKNIISSLYDDSYYETELTKNISQEISLIKGSGISSKNYYSLYLPSDVFSKVFNDYLKWLNENRMMDFDDINTCTYRLLKTRPRVLQRWQNKFKYILVDEFQDINRIQYLILKMLALPENNLFIVGDDDQSIYGFRGSDPGIMLNFPNEFETCKRIYLINNYRSTSQILSAADKVISGNKRRYKKHLNAVKGSGADVEICIYENIWKELDELSLKIRKAHREGTRYGDMAVLVRTNLAARPVLERFLSDRIPYTAGAEIPSIHDHFIAKDIIAYLEIAAGKRDREDFLRIINKPNRYLAKAAFYEKTVSFEQLYMYYEDRSWMCDRIEELESHLKIIGGLAPYGGIQYIRKAVGYDDYIRDYAAERKIPSEELFELLDDIMESARPFKTTAQWRSHIQEFSAEIKRMKTASKDDDAVNIITFHGSKGKEYDIVFLPDVNEGILPFRKAVSGDEKEEERRLLYVGMTRARKNLHICAVSERYEKEMKVSGFLEPLLDQIEKRS